MIQPCVARFRAQIVLTFDAPSLAECGGRMRELASAASAVGFELERGQVEEVPPGAEEASGWTPYGPLNDE